METYAHSLRDRPETEWELLEEHAKAVALRARAFAGSFDGQEIAGLLGMVHDLGKIETSLPAEARNHDLGWMLHDIDYNSGRRSTFFHAVMKDGVIDVAEARQKELAS